MKRIRSANDGSSVEYIDEMPIEGGGVEVEAEAKTKKMEIELRFKLTPVKEGAKGGFEVADVVIDEVSLVNNYREQFAKIIKNEGFEALLSKMEAQVKKVKG
jgi:phospholipid transport system substrate-binding protein